MRHFEFIGRIATDLELKQSKTGKSFVNFCIAANGNGNKETRFFYITAWGKRAENLCKYNKKGNRIYVSGQIDQIEYTQDDKKQHKINFIANNIEYLENRTKNDTSSEVSFIDDIDF